MYKIIGADQKEYGPVTADQINQWIAQGRVNPQTKAQAEGGEWKPLTEFPEFIAAFGHRAPAAAAPPLASGVPPLAARPVKISAMAICSLIFGFLGIFTCGTFALVGLILGILAMVKVKKSNGALGGWGIALAGTIVSGVFLLLLPLWAAMLLPALAKAKQRAQSIQCLNNGRQLAVAARIYSANHDGHFPPAATWCDALKSEVPNEKTFKCPAAGQNDRCDYAFNARLDGMDTKNVDGETVLFFETEDSWNANGGPELMPHPWRHGNRLIVAFADGHAEVITTNRLSELRWNP